MSHKKNEDSYLCQVLLFNSTICYFPPNTNRKLKQLLYTIRSSLVKCICVCSMYIRSMYLSMLLSSNKERYGIYAILYMYMLPSSSYPSFCQMSSWVLIAFSQSNKFSTMIVFYWVVSQNVRKTSFN